MWRRQALHLHKKLTQETLTRRTSQLITTKEKPEPALPEINKLDIGNKVHGFVVKNKQLVPEFRLTAVLFEHEQTRAQYLHLFRNDNNNVFSVNFRTTPMNSTGLPHILEHIVLCGSKLFPVRDPFFKMLNRSLATFMNAMTGSDYTMYPFSTQNNTDFHNLQKIYLDAVFNPNIRESDFRQEGWRLENSNPTDIKSNLIIKGVVYNEMKGVFSENNNIFAQKLQNLMLPDHTYGIVSGGDPLMIPSLTWEDLKQFHKNHYHPSNARFFSYGNFPVLPSLEYINEKYLSEYKYLEPKHTEIPKQARWNQAKTENITGRYEKMREQPFEKQNTLAVSLLMSDITDFYETFLLQVVTELLISGPNAPFYKNLIETNFSGGYTPSTGFDSQPRDSVFTVGLDGLKKADFPRMLSLYEKAIDEVILKGFSKMHVDSVIHRIELSLKHEQSNFGLSILFGISPAWNHTNDIIEGLKVTKYLDKLKQNLQDNPEYLQTTVKKYFKDNQHRLTLSLSPDKEYDVKFAKDENKIVDEKVKQLKDEEKTKIYEKGLELLKEQSEIQNLDILPTLEIEDISTSTERILKSSLKTGPIMTQVNKVDTNGIAYFKAVLNTSDLTQEQQMLLPLFCYVITKLGTNKMAYTDFDNLVNTTTGGLSLNVHVAESLYHLHNYEPGIVLSSHCLEKNIDRMWDIWQQVFGISELSNIVRFETLVKLYISNLTNGVADAGHIYAMQAAAGLVSGTAYQKDLLFGLQHITYMKRLVKISNYKAMLDEILSIAKIVFDKNRMRCSLNMTTEMSEKKELISNYNNFINNVPHDTVNIPTENAYVTGKVWSPQDAVNCQHHVLTIPVYYCSKAVLTSPYTSPEFAQLRVLARLLSAKYLHPELREKRGAYGGGARITPDGVFTFYTYRDPNHLQSLDIFDGSHKWFESASPSLKVQDIVEAKLGVFQTIDAPIPPSSKGNDEFIRRLTPDILERHRAAVMAVSLKDLQEVSAKYLKNISSPMSSKVILGQASEALKTSGREDELWTVVDN